MLSILLSNDDGVHAPGLAALAASLAPLGEVHVVAPDRNRSAASNSLTLDTPLRANRLDNGFVAVNGTPTDCVHLAITGLLDPPPDIVVAGINCGPNLGDDVLSSGTVAAAMEGRFLGRPAIAVSLAGAGPCHYETAARVARLLVERLEEMQLPRETLLNVNVPDRSWAQLAGLRATRLGARHRANPTVRAADPRGLPVYWVGEPGAAADAADGTDFAAIAAGAVSVTPLTVNLTRRDALAGVEDWLRELAP
ncbi:MAG TPA: 5'/3'-nucleotidase SurE [Gammaproteobacteria bacterium]|nr:5'/3'-nucleotidase SurE [Gammaproteobacteria bacterium]